MCQRIIKSVSPVNSVSPVSPINPIVSVNPDGSSDSSPVVTTPTTTPAPVKRNYLKEYYSRPVHDLDIFSPAAAATSDEKVEELQKIIQKAQKSITDATSKISEIYSNRYIAYYTPTKYRSIAKYHTRNDEYLYFDLSTGFRIVEDSIDTTPTSTDIVIDITSKKGSLYTLAGYVYDEAAIVVKLIAYSISQDNVKINRTISSEYCINLFDKTLWSSSKPIPYTTSSITSVERGLSYYPCEEFINELYGTSRSIPFDQSTYYYNGGHSLYNAIAQVRSNVNFELIIKQAPDEVLSSLLWDPDSSTLSEHHTLYELCGLDKPTYTEALSKGVLLEAMSLKKILNRRVELHKTPAEIFSLIEKCRTYEKDLKFYSISHSMDYYLRYDVGTCENAQLFGLIAGTYLKEPNFQKYYSFGKLLDYVVQETINQGYSSVSTFLGELKDYLRMCEANSVTPSLFSSYLKQTHDIAARNTRLSISPADEDTFKSKYATFKKYTNKNYMVIAPASTEAVKDEGCQLNHCVASYIKRVIDGECLIYFLRTDEKTSLITLEVENDVIVQARGLHNRQPDEEELSILKDFAEKRGMTCDY